MGGWGLRAALWHGLVQLDLVVWVQELGSVRVIWRSMVAFGSWKVGLGGLGLRVVLEGCS